MFAFGGMDDARADCPAAPLTNPEDLAISFLAANGSQVAPGNLMPTTVKEGVLIYDEAVSALKMCDGTNWVGVGSGGGTLAGLSDVNVTGVSSGQILSWSGTAWVPMTLATPPVMIPAGEGTLIGNMTQNGGLAAAFDGNTSQTDVAVAYFNAASGWVGKEYSTAKNVTSWKAWGSSDWGFHNGNDNGPGTWAIQYKDTACTNDSGWTTADSISITTNNQTIDRAFSSVGAHLCWRIKLVSGAGIGHSRTAELQFFLPGAAAGDTLASLSCAAGEIPKWSGSAWACAADGGGGAGTVVAFRAHKNNTPQAIGSSVATKLTLGTEDFDTNNNFDTGNSRFTPTVAGIYQVTGSVRCDASTTYCQAIVYKNGVGIANHYDYSSTANMAHVTTLVSMNGSSDYLELYGVSGGAGGNINGISGNTYFEAALVGGGGGGGGSGGGGTDSSMILVSAAQTYADGGKANFNTVVMQTGSNITQSTGEVTLKGGHTYRMIADLRLTTANTALAYSIVEKVSGAGVSSVGAEHTGTAASGWSQSSAYAVVSPGVDTTYYVKTSSLTGAPGTAAGQGTFYVEQIHGGSDTLAGLSCTTGEIPKWSGTAWACAADGGGSGSPGTDVSVFAYRSLPHYAISSATETTIDFTHERFDSNNNFDLSTDRFTPTVAGKYIVSASVTSNNAVSNGVITYVTIRKNNTSTIAAGYAIGSGNSVTPQATGIVEMNGTTDYLQVRYYDASASPVVYGSDAYTFFTAALLGGGSDTLAGLSCTTGQIPKWSGSAWACAADGGGGGSSSVGFRVWKGGGALTIGYNILTTYTESFDTDSSFNESTGVFTAPVDGTYIFTGSAATGQSPSNYLTYFAVNGTSVTSYGNRFASAGSGPISTVTAIYQMNAGDTVRFGIYSDAGVSHSAVEFSGALFGGGGGGSDTLAGLSCTSGQVPSWNGTTWICANGGNPTTITFSGNGNATINWTVGAPLVNDNARTPWVNIISLPSYLVGLRGSDKVNGGNATMTITGGPALCYLVDDTGWAQVDKTGWTLKASGLPGMFGGQGNRVYERFYSPGSYTLPVLSAMYACQGLGGDGGGGSGGGAGTPYGTWQNVTASRAFGSTYTNSDSTGLMVNVGFRAASAGNAVMVCTVGGVALPSSSVNAPNNGYGDEQNFIVPPGATYSCTGGGGAGATLNGWYELSLGGGGGGGGSDTLAGLSCTSGQIPLWNGSAWTCMTSGGTSYSADLTGGMTIAGTFTFTGSGGAIGNAGLIDNTAAPAADPAGANASQYFSIDFGSGNPKHIRRVNFKTAPTGGYANPITYNFQWSDNNAAWTTVGTMVVPAGTNTTTTFDFPASGAHRYWRAYYLSGTTGGNTWVEEIEMMEMFSSGGATPGGANTQVQFNDGGSALGGHANFTFDKTANTNEGRLSLGSAAANTAGAIVLDVTGKATANSVIMKSVAGLSAPTGGTGLWATNATDVWRLTGNVGIGTSTPAYKLDVGGNVQAAAFLYSSDINLKKDIEVLDGQLDKLSALRPVSYVYKKDTAGARHMGLIAQDVQKIFPEIVYTGDNGMLAIDYVGLVAPAIESIKELKAENDALKAQNEAILKRLEALEEAVTK